MDLLIEDASHLLGKLEEDKIFPKKFSPALLLIPFFTVITVILLIGDFTSTPQKQEIVVGERFKHVGIRIERYTKKEFQKIKNSERGPQKELYEKMEKIAKELKDPSMKKRNMLCALCVFAVK